MIYVLMFHVGLEEPTTFEPENVVGIKGETCGGYPVDAFSAAQIVHLRLRRFMAGEHKAVGGFSYGAPTEYLGMLGVAEAMLYTLRLYEVVIGAGVRAATGEEAEDLAQHAALNKERIEFILGALKQGYDSDPLMRALPEWMNLLADSALSASAVVSKMHHLTPETYNPCDASPASPQIKDLVPYFHGSDPSSAHAAAVADHFTLQNGVQMPSMGLGTWLLQGKDCYEAILAAIGAGYRYCVASHLQFHDRPVTKPFTPLCRSIDTAQAYQNEENVGDAVQEAIHRGMVTREELFIATKLSDAADAGYEGVKALVQRQLRDLQTPYLDLYMLHSPLSDAALQADTWRALEELLAAGVLRAIGVSNFDSVELQALMASATVKPMVVQNKVDVYHVAKQLDNRGDPIVKFARDNNILVVAYSSFSAYPFVMKPTEDPIVRSIARRTGLSPAQVILRWSMQKGFAVIPRSISTARLQENISVLRSAPLSTEDMRLLDTLQLLVSSPVCVPGEQ
jgi:diketogulonate reductase-like aldo/keto reductase